ncbi:IS3 family transposase [Mycoplasmatota bacterium]|nr:IS3 family transposase [Mycoplasmatota bacterium]QVK18242.1 IS3 family transposase [Mycoplasmatota bacterium]
MSINVFNETEIELIKNNPNVKRVSSKSITYTLEFKIDFMHEYRGGKLPRQIFIEHGFDVDIIGMKRIEQCATRWKRLYNDGGVVSLDDSRKDNRGRYKHEIQTEEQEIEKLKAKIALIEMENDMLKKLDESERRNGKEIRKSDKFEMIKKVIHKSRRPGIQDYLCSVAEVSRSGYYNYHSEKSKKNRMKKEQNDKKRFKLIKEVFEVGKKKYGAKQIKMHLKENMNLKSIRRIMSKYGLVCKIRRQDPYKQMLKADQNHRVHKNHLNRNFDQQSPYKVLLTDITYIRYNNRFAYLSTILDGSTKELVAYKVSNNLKIDFVLDTVKELDNINLPENAIIHSDQGSHYTSPKFSKEVRSRNLLQSMSRRGNCWDNAPIESFFGHMKDYIDFSECKTLKDVELKIDDYMYYYNHQRYQWKLNKLTPIEFRNQLKAA